MHSLSFTLLVVAVAVGMVPHARAAPQAEHVPRIGLLLANSPSDSRATRQLQAFRQGLRERGYVEGQNIAIESRWAEGRYEQLPASPPTWSVTGMSFMLPELVGKQLEMLKEALPKVFPRSPGWLLPHEVYLHAGTRRGARALDLDHGSDSLCRFSGGVGQTNAPDPFRWRSRNHSGLWRSG